MQLLKKLPKEKCVICMRDSYHNNFFFRWKQPQKRFGETRPWRHHEAQWLEDFLGINFVNENKKMCGFCLTMIKRYVSKGWKPFGDLRNKGFEREVFGFFYDFFTRRKDMWELACCEMIAARLELETKAAI